MSAITRQRVPAQRARRHLRGEVNEVLAGLKPLDLNILRWLLRYPLSRVEDVAQALARVENPSRKHGWGKALDEATVYRHLEMHLRLDLVERVIAPGLGRRCALYHLSNLGLHVLAANMHPPRSASALARKCRTDERGLLALLPRIAQLVAMQDLINGIDILAPSQLAVLGKPVRVWWSNVRDYRYPFFYRERARVAAADGGIVLQARPQPSAGGQAADSWYCLFILLDSGLHSVDLITHKLRNLLYYRECPQRWMGDQFSYDDFPPILVLTTTNHRVEHWQSRVRQLSMQTGTRNLNGIIISQEEINTEKNSERFPWLLNWKKLSGEGTISLKDIFVPIPPEAIPPGMVLPHEWHTLDLEDPLPESTAKLAERPLPQVIQGHFNERAERLRARGTPGENEQENIGLLGLSLTGRQRDLLRLLLDCPLLSTADISALLNVKLASAERYLRDLYGSGYLDLVDTHRYQREICTWAPKAIREKLVVQDDIGKLWMLTEQGMLVLAASLHFSVHAIAIERGEALNKRGIGTDEEAPAIESSTATATSTLLQRASIGLFTSRRVEHQSGIYSFFAGLSRATQQENERLRKLQEREQQSRQPHPSRYALLWWEMGIFTEHRYQHLDTMHNLRPDAAAEYHYREGETLWFWLEWDRNTMGTSDLEEKFDAYLYYLGSGEYRVRDKWRLPWILVVVPGPDQEQRIARTALKKLKDVTNFHLRVTTVERLRNKGALGEIWLPVLPPPPPDPCGTQRCRFFEGAERR